MKMSPTRMRKLYIWRFVFRIAALLSITALYFLYPESFDVLDGNNFFERFSPLHLLWAVWIFDMIMQLIPTKGYLSIGSQKQFIEHYIPLKEKVNLRELFRYVKKSTVDCLKVLALWIFLVLSAWTLKALKVLGKKELFVLCCVFYVFDLFCVLFWCPFRVWLMKNRCCTTCRIFNWDHLMMFSPLFFIAGFYSASLIVFAMVVLITWEICIFTHPERFWEGTNKALKCENCSDYLCGGQNCTFK